MIFPQLQHYKPLIRFIDHLLKDGSTWNKIDQDDIEIMAGHAITALGSDAYVCLSESEDLDKIIYHLGRQLLTGKVAWDLQHTLCNAAAAYFAPDFQELFTDRAELHEYDVRYDAGYKLYKDPVTGENEWVKRA